MGNFFTIPTFLFFFVCIFIVTLSFIIKKPFILFFNFILLGWLSVQNYNQIPKNHYQNVLLENSYCEALIVEKGKTSQNNFTSFQVEIQSVFNDSICIQSSGRALVYLKDSIRLLPNTTILFKNVLDSIPTPKNPYSFDYASFLKRKRIYHQAFLHDFMLSPSLNWNFIAFSNNIREKITEKIELRYGKNEESTIVKAMLLGEKDDLTFAVKQSYSKTGTMHLLAISGLHTGIIYGCFYFALYFLTFLPKGKTLQIVSSILLLWGYASITGFSASVCRASLMITLFQLSHLLNRDTNSVHTICVSAFILLIVNPNFLFDVGFQLSYSAVLSIILFFPYFQNSITFRYTILRYYYHAILISIIATFGTLPLTLYYFNSFPTLFLISNVVITPLFGFIMSFGLIILVLLLLQIQFPFLEFLFLEVISFMNSFISLAYNLDLHIETIYFSAIQVVLSYFILIAFYFFLKRKKYIYIYISCGLLLSVQCVYLYHKVMRYHLSEFIIFDSYKNPVIGIKEANKLMIFSENDISKKDYYYILYPYITHQYINQVHYYHLKDSFEGFFIKTKNIFQFKNQIIWINPPNAITKEEGYVFVSDSKLLKKRFKKNVITNRYHISDSIYQIPKKGAFRLQVSFEHDK